MKKQSLEDKLVVCDVQGEYIYGTMSIRLPCNKLKDVGSFLYCTVEERNKCPYRTKPAYHRAIKLRIPKK